MTPTTNKTYSGKQITRAGKEFEHLQDFIDNEDKFNEVMDALSYWRFCHETPLNKAWNVLKKTVTKHDKDALFAKRLKRFVSIHEKLNRFPNMTLRNMQDIGGCRAIVENEKKLYKSVRDLKKLKEFKTQGGKYRAKNYIKRSKPDGYKGYHLIGRFCEENGTPRNIEVQLRTSIQHYWATAVEIVDLFTGQALKSNQGDPKWEAFFREVSSQFSVMDNIPLFSKMGDNQRFVKYRDIVSKSPAHHNEIINIQKKYKSLKVSKKLLAFRNSIAFIDKKISKAPESGYILLKVNTEKGRIQATVFLESESEKAALSYIKAEKNAARNTDIVVALVSTSKLGGVKQAYPNFFADSYNFMQHLGIILTTQQTMHQAKGLRAKGSVLNGTKLRLFGTVFVPVFCLLHQVSGLA